LEEETMKGILHRRPSPAMIVACVALAVALGGTSYAAVALAPNSVGTKQLKKNAVTAEKIRNGAVTSVKIKDNGVKGADVNEASLTEVPNAAHARNADTATNATSAVDAATAGTATNATNATNAANADRLDSLDSTAFARTGRLASTVPLHGPLPTATGTMTSQGGRFLISVSGSGFRSAVGTGCIDILVETSGIDTLTAACHYFNQTFVHEALVTRTLLLDVSPGTFTIRLQPLSGLLTDASDRYDVMILEIP
jgi:hypothetical protein